MTRLDCVKQTINSQIKEMATKYPERKVGLVTFTDTIDIIGDGHLPNTSVGGDNLENYDFIMKNGLACATTQFTKSVKEVSENL